MATLVNGPRLGWPTASSMKVWVRSDGAASVTLETKLPTDTSWTLQDTQAIDTGLSNTAVLEATGLAASTKYDYRVAFDDVVVGTFYFITMPPASGGRFLFIHVSDFHNDLASPMQSGLLADWQTNYPTVPVVVFCGGDFYAYNTSPNDAATRAQEFYDMLDSWGTTLSYMPFLYMWDDHDYGGNNSGGSYTPRADDDTVPQTVWNWTVRDHETLLTDSRAWVLEIAGVPLVATDQRSAKASQTGDVPSLAGNEGFSAASSSLGLEQYQWLKDRISDYNTRALMLIMTSTTPMDNTGDASQVEVVLPSGSRRDGWGSWYKQERIDIMEHAAQLGCGWRNNIAWIVGDDHRNWVCWGRDTSRAPWAADDAGAWPGGTAALDSTNRDPGSGVGLPIYMFMTKSGDVGQFAQRQSRHVFGAENSPGTLFDVRTDEDSVHYVARWDITTDKNGTLANARVTYIDLDNAGATVSDDDNRPGDFYFTNGRWVVFATGVDAQIFPPENAPGVGIRFDKAYVDEQLGSMHARSDIYRDYDFTNLLRSRENVDKDLTHDDWRRLRPNRPEEEPPII